MKHITRQFLWCLFCLDIYIRSVYLLCGYNTFDYITNNKHIMQVYITHASFHDT